MRFYEESDLLKPRICNRCEHINAPTYSWCSKCGFPLTWEEWVKYEKQKREMQYIEDLQFLDRYHPELDPPKKTSKRQKLPKQKVARCYMCLTLSETVVDGEIVDYCPECGAPFSDKTIIREHWIQTHPEEAKEELRKKLEILKNVYLETCQKNNNIEQKSTKLSREEVVEILIKDPSLILEALKKLEKSKYEK